MNKRVFPYLFSDSNGICILLTLHIWFGYDMDFFYKYKAHQATMLLVQRIQWNCEIVWQQQAIGMQTNY